ncbi:MAG: hypothetical protein ACLSGA_04365 [Ruminococcus sp.]
MDDFYILFCKKSMEIESLYYYNKTSAGHLENIACNVYRERVTVVTSEQYRERITYEGI